MMLSRVQMLLPVLLGVVGCRTTPEPTSYIVPELPVVVAPTPSLQQVAATSLEPKPSELPTLEVAIAYQADVAQTQWLGLSMEQCRDAVAVQTQSRWSAAESEWEQHLTDAAVAEAIATNLQHYYDLAERLGQHDILSESVPIMNDLAEAQKRAVEYGLAMPVTATQLERQQLHHNELMHKTETAAMLSDIALKRALGLPSNTGQLRPTMELKVPNASAYDEATLIDSALMRRADLLALRSLYLSMNVETVPSIETFLRQQIPTLARLPVSDEKLPSAEAILRFAQLRAALHQEILHRERVVADEVRSAIANLKLKHKAVATARFNVDRQAEIIEAKAGQGPLVELPAQLEAIELRARLMSAVCDWHRANVQLQAATGNAP